MYRGFSTGLAIVTCLVLSLASSPAHALPDGTDAPALRPALDPFRALVREPEPVIEAKRNEPELKPSPPPIPPPPPVNFRVNALAGDDRYRQAVVEFEGQIYMVEPGTKVPSDDNVAFEVKLVDSEKVEVFDPKTNRIVRKQLELN
jgi:hypothetical protein